MKAIVCFLLACMLVAVPSAWAGWKLGTGPAGEKIWFGPGYVTRNPNAMGQDIWTAGLASGGKVPMSTPTVLNTASGPAAATLSGLVGPAQVLATMGTILGGPPVAFVSGLILIPGVLDWLLQADVRPTVDKTGLEMRSSTTCSVAPCYEYRGNTEVTGPWASSPEAASAAHLPLWLASMNASFGGGWAASFTGCTAWNRCLYSASYQGGSAAVIGNGMTQRSSLPVSPRWVPASYPDYQQRLSGVPVSTDLINSLLDAGYQFPLDSPQVTGPASVRAPDVVTTTNITNNTTNNAGHTTTTTTTTNVTNLSYTTVANPVAVPTPAPAVGPNVTAPTVGAAAGTTTTTTTTATVDNATGAVISTMVSAGNVPAPIDLGGNDGTAPSSEPAPEPVFTDTALPDVPKLYERKYPDGLSGIWTSKIVGIKATPLFSLVGNLRPTGMASSGACPSWPLAMNYATWANFGTHDVAPPCWVWEFGKVVITISALLLASALIFGG